MRHFLFALLLLTGCIIREGGIALAEPSDSKTNIVFVVDTSGSMAGEKIVQLRSALTQTLALLPNDANVGLLEFASDFQWVYPLGKLDRQAMRAQIERLDAGGGTNIGDALHVASIVLEEHRGRFAGGTQEASFRIVLMSDGMQEGWGLDPVQEIPEIVKRKQGLNVIGIEFEDRGIKAALAQSGLTHAYHEVHQARELFRTIKQVLNLESVRVDASGRAGDLSVLTNVPPEVIQALLSALVSAERQTR